MADPNSIHNIHPLAQERLDEISKNAKYPLLLLLGVSGVGKSSIIEKLLLEGLPGIVGPKKMKRPTTRKPKERDSIGDFDYLTDEEMQQGIGSGDILLAYDSHRNDGSVYGLYYEELKKLAHNPMITAIGQGGLKIIEYVPSIVCCLFRDEDGIKNSLEGRLTDNQTGQNITHISRDTVSFLQKASFVDIMIENETGSSEHTVESIKQAISYLSRKKDHHAQILESLFETSIIENINGRENTLFENNLVQFLTNGNSAVSAEKIDSLLHFMYTEKFSSLRRYFKLIKSNGAEKTSEGIQEDIALMYIKTAEILYTLGYMKEAQHILLQIGIREYAFPKNIKSDTTSLIESQIDIVSCLSRLSPKYDYFKNKGNEILFVHNTYAFGWKAAKLAGETMNILLYTKGVEILKSTSMRGEFKIKLESPYMGIEYIRCDIVKDRE